VTIGRSDSRYAGSQYGILVDAISGGSMSFEENTFLGKTPIHWIYSLQTDALAMKPLTDEDAIRALLKAQISDINMLSNEDIAKARRTPWWAAPTLGVVAGLFVGSETAEMPTVPSWFFGWVLGAFVGLVVYAILAPRARFQVAYLSWCRDRQIHECRQLAEKLRADLNPDVE
jgi:hypothetical protein